MIAVRSFRGDQVISPHVGSFLQVTEASFEQLSMDVAAC